MTRKSTKTKYIFGFTLIEVMVSVSIFTVIMTVGLGALVKMTNSYNISRDQKTVADNLSFMMESMMREIRLGSNYYSGSGAGTTFIGESYDGTTSSVGFSLSDPGGARGYYMSYSLDPDLNSSSADFGVLKRYRYDSSSKRLGPVADLNDSQTVVIDEITFAVIGSLAGDNHQPLVWIRVKAHSPRYPDLTISLQTLASQRSLNF